MHESSNYDGKRRVCQFNRRMLMLSLNAVTGQWKNIESLEVIKEYRTSFAMSMNILFIVIAMETLRPLKGQGRRKGVISAPTSGSS